MLHVWLLGLIGLIWATSCGGLEYTMLLQASQHVFSTHDGSSLNSLSDVSVLELHNLLKKTIGVLPSEDLNMTRVRELPDSRLTEILLLALVGNFTTAKSQSWQQPCKIVMNAKDGHLQLSDDRSLTDEILSVLIIILCIVQFKQILEREG